MRFLLILSLLATHLALAQDYTQHQWIVTGQTYLKIGPISTDGVYRATGTLLLANADFAAANPDLSRLHMYYKGQEIPIYIKDNNNNNRLDSDDQIEWMAYRADGLDDADLYRNEVSGLSQPSGLANPYRSLFEDNSYCYLTWNNTLRNSSFTFAAITTPSNYATVTQQTFYRHTQRNDLRTQYFKGIGSITNLVAEGFLNPDYTPGEGHNSNTITTGTAFTVSISTTNIFGASTNPVEVETRLTNVSRLDNFSQNPLQHTVRVGATSQTFTSYGVNSIQRNFNVQIADLGSPSTAVVITPLANDKGNNTIVPYVLLRYDRLTKFSNETQTQLNWNNVANEDRYFYLETMNIVGEGLVFDLSNRRRISAIVAGTNMHVVVPKGVGGQNQMWATSSGTIQTLSNNLTVTTVLTNRLSSPTVQGSYVIIAPKAYSAVAEDYATYRRQRFPNAVVVAYTEDVYDEFSFGRATPLAYKRLINYALNNWAVKPQYLLLLGDATHSGGSRAVFTWSIPACDFEFVSNFTPSTAVDYVPRVSVGRIDLSTECSTSIPECRNSSNPNVTDCNKPECRQAQLDAALQKGTNYLNKVKEYESQPFEGWMKKGLFFGGGAYAGEQTIIESTLSDMKADMEDCPFAGTGFQYQKRTTQNTVNEEIPEVSRVIDEGINSIAFFGHSNSQRWDLEILPPSTYKNFNRYPFVYAAGCYTGNFLDVGSSGEHWVTEANRGAIGWLSNTDLGLLSQLREYMLILYDKMYDDSLRKPVGHVIRGTIQQFRSQNGSAHGRNHIRCIALQADPAIILHAPQGPDLVLDETMVSFDPEAFGVENDSVTVVLTPQNFGVCFVDSFDVRIEQYDEQGNLYTHALKKFAPYTYTDTLKIRIRNQGIAKPGRTRYVICLDSQNKIAETDETNNCATIERQTPTLVPALIYPWPYAVINEQAITLRASTYGVTQDVNMRYVFEIDTVIEFSSPMKRNALIIGNTLLGEWTLPAPYDQFRDSTVYYWRVRLADAPTIVWATGSFQYINGPKQGWAQARPPQFFEDSYNQLKMNRLTRSWEFDSRQRTVAATSVPPKIEVNKGECATTDFPYNENNALFMLGIDANTLNCYGFNQFMGNADFLRISATVDFSNFYSLIDKMPANDYIIIVGKTVNRTQLPQAFFDHIAKLGISNRLQTLTNEAGTNTFSFSWIGQKGAAIGSAKEAYSVNKSDTPDEDVDPARIITTLQTQLPTGKVTSTLVGPAKSWNDLIWDWKSNNLGTNEDIRVDLYGVTATGQEQILMSNLTRGTYDLTGFSAISYPYMMLRGTLTDNVDRTAPNLDNWYILYEQLPDAAIDPYVNFSFLSDNQLEGADLTLNMNVRNLTSIPMDSLLVRWQVRKQDGTLLTLHEAKGAPLPADATIYPISHTFNSTDLVGTNTLIVTLNPDFAQPESYFFNNVYNHTFTVKSDIINPILDVTFDGKRIMDGDVVSPKPEIVIELNDENPYFAITSADNFELYFKKDNLDEGDKGELITMNSGHLTFEPATLPQNKARITFKPEQLEDGDYVLTVNGEDASENLAGRVRYRIKFKVVNESTVTDVLNYPNPFSTCTKFVYRLTGAEYPDVFQIQIFTVTGKLVRNLDLKELGEVHIGQHITEYCWDGTDEFGDKLANGVYLYRVNLKMPGDMSIKKEDELTSEYFKNGWGKLYIMR